jgi:hypothetical protein
MWLLSIVNIPRRADWTASAAQMGMWLSFFLAGNFALLVLPCGTYFF